VLRWSFGSDYLPSRGLGTLGGSVVIDPYCPAPRGTRLVLDVQKPARSNSESIGSSSAPESMAEHRAAAAEAVKALCRPT
jgi:hypothetical protein